MNYIDIVIIAILVLFALMGILCGFRRSLRGFFHAILIVLIGLAISSAITVPLLESNAGSKLEASLLKSAESWGEGYNNEIYKGTDGVVYIVINGESKTYDQLDMNAVAKFFAVKMANNVASPEGGYTLADYIVPNIAAIIIAAVSFVVMCILVKIIMLLIRMFWGKLMDKDNSAGKRIAWVWILDRVFGVLLWAVYAFVLIFTILAILNSIPVDSIHQTIASSSMGSALQNGNLIAKMFDAMFISRINLLG